MNFQFGVEELYIISQAGSTPVLSLLGGLPKAEKPERPFVNESNIIMYLDMVNEKGVELKGIAQFVDAQAKAKTEKKDFLDSKLTVGLGGLLGNNVKTLSFITVLKYVKNRIGFLLTYILSLQVIRKPLLRSYHLVQRC